MNKTNDKRILSHTKQVGIILSSLYPAYLQKVVEAIFNERHI